MLSKIKSVHLQNFPNVSNIKDEKDLIKDMDKVRDICSTALAIRDKQNLRVRLPLNKVTIIGKDTKKLEKYKNIITDEINVKNIEFIDEIGDLAEFELKLDFKKLGAKLGPKIKDIIKASKTGNWKRKEKNEVEINGTTLSQEDYTMSLVPKNTETTAALSTNDALVQLDINVTEELKLEGLSRDLVRLIQQNRKKADLNIADRIDLYLNVQDDFVQKAINKNSDYIKEQTLSVSLKIGNEKGKHSFENEINNQKITISFSVK